jgi:C4-type Zn-finger protein
MWKRLVALPQRLAELEARVTALEGKARPSRAQCPICHATMKTTAVAPDPIFGQMGVQRHTMVCPECQHTENRQVDPKKL